MPCSVTAAIGVNCKEAVGGVKRVFVGASDIDLVENGTFTQDASGYVTAIPATTFYQWDFHPEKCSFEARIQANAEMGTIFYEQTLSLSIAHLDVEDQAQLELLAKGKPPVIVELNTGKLLLMGARNGCDVTGGGASSGTRFGDATEMTLDLTAKEYDTLVYHIAASSGAGTTGFPLDNLSGATIG